MGYQSRGYVQCVLCTAMSIGRKLCRRHYIQMRNDKRLHEFPLLGPHDVFHSRYTKEPNGCWVWTTNTNRYGYGIFLLPGEKRVRAHRFSYELEHGPIPEGKIIMHTCDNPPCVNPDHLRLGTKAENNKDTGVKRRHHYGLDHWNGRLSDADVQAIRESTESQACLAIQFGVCQSHISRIRSWKNRPLVLHR